MADSKARGAADLVNWVPKSYDDSDVSQQPADPRRGDLWFSQQPLPFEKPLKVVRPGRSLRRFERISPAIRKLPPRKA